MKKSVQLQIACLLGVAGLLTWPGTITAEAEESERPVETEVQAENGIQADDEVVVTESFVSGNLADSDALLTEYATRALEDALPGESDNTYEAPRYNRLSSWEKDLYRTFRKAITDVAAGRKADTKIDFTVNPYSYSREGFNRVIEALEDDLPYEFYWYDKGRGGEWTLYRNGSGTAYLCVSGAYSKSGENGTYEVNTAKTGRTRAAVDRAKEIAARADGMTDYEALHYFKDQICSLVSYDYEAAAHSSSYSLTDRNPWQLIYVFDGDPSTNVVCEGYAKAFKYLCDLHGFSTATTDCYLVSGTLYGHRETGGHMWNIVHWSDGRNYMVDVTNCDADNGDSDVYFLVGAEKIEKIYYSGVRRTRGYWIGGIGWDYVQYNSAGRSSTETLDMYTEWEIGIASRDVKPADETKTSETVTFGWKEYAGDAYWYEDGIRQGTAEDPKGVWYDGTNRGREIYDPSSNAWYWLDSIYDGAKATGKEVFMPYVYNDETKEQLSDEKMRELAGASDDGLQDYIYARIKDGRGKWVRYDQYGRMLKGWQTITGSLAAVYPDQAGNTYYYDNKTGAMVTGTVTMNGRTYHFNDQTGVLEWSE